METLKIKSTKDLKNFVTNKDNIKIMRSLFEAIAYTETLRDIIETKQKEIINFYKFKPCERWQEKGAVTPKFIERHGDMYLCSDQDFNLYHKEMQEFYFSDNCPVKPSKPENCPLLEAESLVRNIKRQIADIFKPYFGFGADDLLISLKRYNEYFELLMTMFAGQIKNIQLN